MTTPYNVDAWVKGVNGYGLRFSDQNYTATLAAATDTSLIVPTTAAPGTPNATTYNKFIAVIQPAYGVSIFIALNAAASAPAGAAFAASTSVLVPPDGTARYVKAGDTIHFKSTAGGDVSVAFYATQD